MKVFSVSAPGALHPPLFLCLTLVSCCLACEAADGGEPKAHASTLLDEGHIDVSDMLAASLDQPPDSEQQDFIVHQDMKPPLDLDLSPRPTCEDHIQNGDEQEVDCGGSCQACLPERPCPIEDEALVGLTKESERHDVTVEFETDSYSWQPNNTFGAISTTQGYTYIVWTDADLRPRIGQIRHGEPQQVETSPLDADASYRMLDDGHHSFSLGVDREGYIHVAGDMHEYPLVAMNHLPERYKGGRVMYWKSTKPHDITSFDFVGHDEALVMDGEGFSYLSFHADREGTLYARSRSYANSGGHRPGQYGWRLHVYDEETKRWRALGARPPRGQSPQYKAIFWDEGGVLDANNPERSWYQGFMSDIKFDAYNRMHVAVAINSDSTVSSSTHVLYAYSDDHGETFQRADGSLIDALPLGAIEAERQADIVETGRTYWSFVTIALDHCGRPGVGYTVTNPEARYGYEGFYYRHWEEDTSSWSEPFQSPAGGLINAYSVSGRDGVINYFTPDRNGRVHRSRGFTDPGYDIYLGGAFRPVDIRSIQNEGVLRGMREFEGKLQVIRIDIEEALDE